VRVGGPVWLGAAVGDAAGSGRLVSDPDSLAEGLSEPFAASGHVADESFPGPVLLLALVAFWSVVPVDPAACQPGPAFRPAGPVAHKPGLCKA